MRLGDLYHMGIEAGIEADPRGRDAVDRELEDAKERYEKLEGEDRDMFDQEFLWNPYHDSRFLFGDEDLDVERVMWGIDIGTGEMLLADRLRERERVDAVIGHHPIGRARPIFPMVMHMQELMYENIGVPITVAQGVLAPRIAEVSRAVLPSNQEQPVDAARLLGIPLMNLHSPADNNVQGYLQDRIDEAEPRKVGDILKVIKGIEEFKVSTRNNNPPTVFVGKEDGYCGRVAVKMTGGTSGPKEAYEKFAQAGVGTVVYMHAPENHIEEARKHHINIVISGHMASDSLGINLISDRFAEKGVEVVPFSGLIRVKRN